MSFSVMTKEDTMSELKEALQKLDVANENHWTQDGSPRLETVKFLNGGNAVSREDIETAFPGFNKTTATGYWLTYQDPAPAAPQGAEGATPEQGDDNGAAPQQGERGAETPSASGDGAAPEEAKAPGQPITGPVGGFTESEAKQPSMDFGDAGPDEIENLEKAFSQVQEHLSNLRRSRDDLTQEIDKVSQVETEIYNSLERARYEQNDHKTANHIQRYLENQKRLAAERGQARRTLIENGVNLKELSKLVGKSPLDQSMVRPSGRGRGSKGM